jgi:predicted amidophosphoribosyltransferase
MKVLGHAVRRKALLRPVRQIQKQAWLSEKERIVNVRGAFRLRRTIGIRNDGASWLAGRHVLVIDDVMTTGATANEIATVLKAAGVSRVTIAVVARACGS